MATITREMHQQARQAIVDAWTMLFGEPPTLQQAQGLQAMSYHETGYGYFAPFNNAGGAPTFNMGAIQCPKLPQDGVCPCQGFLHKDTRPNSDGTSTEYAVCFRSYNSMADGAVDLIKQVTPPRRPKTAAALTAGDIEAFSAAMYDEHYYEGFGSTREQRIAGHVKAMTNAVKVVATNLGEEIVFLPGGTNPVDIHGVWITTGNTSKDRIAKVAKGGLILATGYLAFQGAQALFEHLSRTGRT